MSNKEKIIAGKNIYKDEKGRTVLYRESEKTGYVIQEKNQQAYNLYANRYAISVIAGILAANFNVPIPYCIAITIGIMAFLEYRYRLNFLPSLVQIKNFKPTENISTLDALVMEKDKKRNLTLVILYPLFGALIIINGLQMKASPLIMGGNILIAIFALYMAVINFIALRKIKS
ncbi:MAG TPA: hypothetical protein PLI19_05290 [Erysipelotrichaceae bacterium]|nr:hypothetical protein [Erysipelotrichaceae bacterium]